RPDRRRRERREEAGARSRLESAGVMRGDMVAGRLESRPPEAISKSGKALVPRMGEPDETPPGHQGFLGAPGREIFLLGRGPSRRKTGPPPTLPMPHAPALRLGRLILAAALSCPALFAAGPYVNQDDAAARNDPMGGSYPVPYH